jgi:hypothetical protein
MVTIKYSSYPRTANEATDTLVKAVLFDLGNTLVSYYSREEFSEALCGLGGLGGLPGLL